MKVSLFVVLLLAFLSAARLCHSRVLWTEEGLPMAAALQIQHGKVLYRDIWFDKPPLVPAVYLLWGVRTGVILRLAGALYALAACWLAFLFSRDLWGIRAGFWAAALMAFFLVFDTPSAVTPIAADLLMLVPHLAAVYFAYRRRALASGIAAGIAFLCNAKALFVLATCAIFCYPAILTLIAGFLAPCALAGLWLLAHHAIPAYLDQVWIWSAAYARSPFLADPFRNGFLRTLFWLGFHGALLTGACLWVRRDPIRWKLLAWAALSMAGVAAGWRFFPRYYFQLLPVFVIAASAAFAQSRRLRFAGLALLLIPLIRFGPRYPLLALNLEPAWADTAMDRDSAAAAMILRSRARPGDSLFVWGYRPDLFVYSELPAASRFLDSQALTGVPADRHLTQSRPVRTATLSAAREELAHSHPTFIADGLSLYNPDLAMSRYPDLQKWLADYAEIGRTSGTVLLQLKSEQRER